MNKELGTAFLTFLAIIFLTIILFEKGLPLGHDIYAHLTYPKLFYHALSEGQFPVRWTEWIKFGFGHPLFNFYQVGFYYFFSLVHFFIPDFIFSIKLSILLLWWLGTFFIFLLTKKFGILPATLASLIYAFSPYLLLDLFIRSAYPEFTAISLIPGVFWALEKTLSQGKLLYLVPFSFLLGAVLISHLPAFIIFAPVLFGYFLLLIINKQFSLKSILYVFTGSILALGLASFYLIPAILELRLISINVLTSNSFSFHQNFVHPQQFISYLWGYQQLWQSSPQALVVFLGLSQWTILTTSFLTVPLYQKVKKIFPYLLFALFTFFYVLFFMQQESLPFWETFKFIQFIQFPWRFFMVVPLLTALSGAALFSLISHPKLNLLLIFFLLIFSFVAYPGILGSVQTTQINFFNLDYQSWQQHPLTKKEAYIEPGYNPLGIKHDIKKEVKRYYIQGQGEAVKQELKDSQMIFDLHIFEPSTFTLTTHYFPGWKAYIDNKEINISSNNPNKYLNVEVPTGNHQLTFKFTDTPIRNTANKITIFSLGTVLSVAIFPIAYHLLRHKLPVLLIILFNYLQSFRRILKTPY